MRAHLGLQACSSAWQNAILGQRRCEAMRSEPVAGLQRARPRESAPAYSWQTGRARAERRERRRGPTAGAAGLRRANVSRGQQEARGARQRVALCFGRVRLVPINWSRARACQWHFGIEIRPRVSRRSVAPVLFVGSPILWVLKTRVND